MPVETLVEIAKLRWRIERDYQDLKRELGLDPYEGRGSRGFHHHMALCVAAYGFLVAERSLIPPPNTGRCSSKSLPCPKVIDPADPPIQPERHIDTSISSLRIKLARSLAPRLFRCPCRQIANLSHSKTRSPSR